MVNEKLIEKIKEQARKYSTYTINNAIDLVSGYDDVNEDNLDYIINDYIDNKLIYYDDQWELMIEYQIPKLANFDNAIEEFYNDLYCIISNAL